MQNPTAHNERTSHISCKRNTISNKQVPLYKRNYNSQTKPQLTSSQSEFTEFCPIVFIVVE